MLYLGVAASLAGGIRVGMGRAPVLTAVLAGVVAITAFGVGLGLARRFQSRAWVRAWAGVGLGLVAAAGAVLVRTLGAGGLVTRPGSTMVVHVVGAVVATAGVAALLHQRLPGRASEALSESGLMVLALSYVTLSLVVVPRQGWSPAHQVAALLPPLLDLVVLWMLSSLVSLTDRHPTSYRFLIAGFLCLFLADAVSAGLTLAGGAHAVTGVDTVALWGVCLGAVAFVHPSQKVTFDPVPVRPTRPSGLRVGLLVGVALVVPGVLIAQNVLGITTRARALVIGSTFLPLLALLYLLRQVFAHAAAEYRAQHDPLTGVCNRLLFEDRLRQTLGQSQRTGASVAVMFLDLDRFKDINDSLGHAVGNQLLQAVVKRLQGCLREQDTLARFGGDEFTLIVPDAEGKDESVVKVAERILERFSDPFSVGARQLAVKASIGVAVSPFDGEDVETLLKHADTAMYQAKAAGRNTFELFDSGMSARARLRFALEDSLRAAVECGRLAVHYQPKMDIATGTIAGVEALARWQHPRLGFIPPWAFIPLAEESSLVATLGQWVLEEACSQARRWQDEGLTVPVAVNLSPRQFGHQPVVDMVKQTLRSSRLGANLLELEVTESVLMEHMSEVATSLDELRAMGVRCSIDDFGTGYNALTYLAEMPVDAIKIDRSFVARIDAGEGGCPIVGAVIALAHSLRLEVVAEGVETDAQLRFLEANGCDQVQGYRFSPPVPAAEMEALLRSPERVFTDWREEVAAMPLPLSVVAPARFEALLDSVLQERQWPTGLDGDVIEAVLAALQPDELGRVKTVRSLNPLSTRLAVGTLAGLASVTGGLTAANALPRSVQAAATEFLGSEVLPGAAGEHLPGATGAGHGGHDGAQGSDPGEPAPLP